MVVVIYITKAINTKQPLHGIFVIPLVLDVRLVDVPAGVTQEEGHTEFLIHLPSAALALIFLARRIRPFLSFLNREVDFLVLTVSSFSTYQVLCVCVFSSHPFWTSSSLDVPAGVTQEEGHTGFLIHLPSAVRALIFVARRIQPFLSLVDREVEFCVLTN